MFVFINIKLILNISVPTHMYIHNNIYRCALRNIITSRKSYYRLR